MLDNIFWHALTGEQAGIAEGHGGARRYARGYSPIVAFADRAAPDFAALRDCCAVGERFHVEGWYGEPPPGWSVVVEATMHLMTWAGPATLDDPAPEAVALGPAHADEAVALARLTNPGPFDAATLRMGEYFGVFEQGRLAAMAGERAHAGPWREVSGICTHPERQGRGLARRLASKVVARQLHRGMRPFLHVVTSNLRAHALYVSMGFVDHHQTGVRILERKA